MECQLNKMAWASIINKGGLHLLSCGQLLPDSQQQENCLPNPTAEFLLCSRAFTDPRGVWQRRWKTIVEVFLWRRCSEGCLPFLSGSDRGVNEVQPQSGLLFLCFSIWSEHKDTFLSHDSEDKGHWVTSKLTPDPCWFRGLSRVFTHRHTRIKTHRAPTDLSEKRPPPTQPIPFYLLRYVSSNLVKTVGLPLLLRLGISRESRVWGLRCIPPRCCKNIRAKNSRGTSFRHREAHRDGACCFPSTTTEVATPD